MSVEFTAQVELDWRGQPCTHLASATQAVKWIVGLEAPATLEPIDAANGVWLVELRPDQFETLLTTGYLEVNHGPHTLRAEMS